MIYFVSAFILIMLIVALILAVLGVFYFLGARETKEQYNNWRGKK